MIRELVNRIVFEVVGEEAIARANRFIDQAAENSEQAARETEEYERALASLRNRLRGVGQAVTGFGRRIVGASRSLVGAGRAVGRFAGGLGRILRRLAVGPLAFGAFIAGAVSLASEAEETRDRMRVALGDIADETEEWATRTSNALGVNRNQVRSFVTDFSLQLQRATDLASATDLGQALTERAFDLESFQDVPIDEVFAAFRSGINGSTEPLDRFNVNLRATAVDAFILANGLAASSSAITENTRRLARARLILQETQNAQGNLILTQTSFANTFRAFRNTLTNIITDIGEGFIPAARDLFFNLTESLRENQDRILDFFNRIAGRLDEFIQNGGLERIAETFGNIADLAVRAAGAVDRFFNISSREQEIESEIEGVREFRRAEQANSFNPLQRLSGLTASGRITNRLADRAIAERIVESQRISNDNTRFAQDVRQEINVSVTGVNATTQQITRAVANGVTQGNRRSLADVSVGSPATR